MAFLTNSQLRHGAWGSPAADSAHSNRGVFAGAREGKIVWREALAPELGSVSTYPVADPAGNLYFSASRGGLQARTPQGAPILIPHPSIGLKDELSLHVGPGPTLVAVCKNALVCVGLDGMPRWRIEGFPGGSAMVAPDGHALYVAQPGPGNSGYVLVALGLGTGIEHWRLPFPGRISGPAIDAEGTLYVVAHYDASPPYRLLAIDGKSGELLWQQKVAPMLALREPRLFGDDLVLVASSEILQAFYRDGRSAWTHALHDPGNPSVSAAGQVAVLSGSPATPQKPSLWTCWPDGPLHREVDPPRGLRFISDPLFDAGGNLYLMAHDESWQKMLLKYTPDLDLVWTGGVHGDKYSDIRLAVLPDAIVLACQITAFSVAPGKVSAESLPSLLLICIR
ncbi:MAG TPA: PQQ-binding-like beta-propeller repeat protein [Planctomycetota bacterium]|nr:PQQ-binding-like beta-propeller repeat protein [Planctomycetota bacterium]